MFEKLYTVFKAGGFTLILMLAGSVLAIAVAIERAIHLWSFQERARNLSETVKRCLYRGAIAEARTACERSRSSLAEVFLVGFERLRRSSHTALGAAVDRERQRLSLSLRGPLWILGTIGATTPFLGLFGTVVGIMGAFRKIGENKQTGIEVVGPYISEALIATAVGIGVAVVALMLFNFFQARLGRINIELRLLVEEFVEILTEPTSQTDPAGEHGVDSERDEASERSEVNERSEKRKAASAKEERLMAIGKVPGSGGDLEDEGIFAEINITPLTDIFLVLLIIFMVTSSVMADAGARSGMRVNLPKGAMREVNTTTQDITILITADGKLVVKGKPVDATELAQMFNDAKQRSPDTQIIVQADESTHHGRVVSVMELAKSSGLHRLAIATRRSSK